MSEYDWNDIPGATRPADLPRATGPNRDRAARGSGRRPDADRTPREQSVRQYDDRPNNANLGLLRRLEKALPDLSGDFRLMLDAVQSEMDYCNNGTGRGVEALGDFRNDDLATIAEYLRKQLDAGVTGTRPWRPAGTSVSRDDSDRTPVEGSVLSNRFRARFPRDTADREILRLARRHLGYLQNDHDDAVPEMHGSTIDTLTTLIDYLENSGSSRTDDPQRSAAPRVRGSLPAADHRTSFDDLDFGDEEAGFGRRDTEEIPRVRVRLTDDELVAQAETDLRTENVRTIKAKVAEHLKTGEVEELADWTLPNLKRLESLLVRAARKATVVSALAATRVQPRVRIVDTDVEDDATGNDRPEYSRKQWVTAWFLTVFAAMFIGYPLGNLAAAFVPKDFIGSTLFGYALVIAAMAIAGAGTYFVSLWAMARRRSNR